MTEKFQELIRVSLGTQNNLSVIPSASEWITLYDITKKQSLVGICFAGVQKLCNSETGNYCGMSESLYFKWMGMAAKIQHRNQQMDEYTFKALGHFRYEKIACYVLKGQGLAQLYGSLHDLRQSGDVDVWVAGGRKNIYALSKRMFGKLEGLTYYHIHYPLFEDCEVEAHIWPSCLASPIRNKALKLFSQMYEPTTGCDNTPPLAFNRVYILLHCYKHFCSRGLGLRQVLDYYYILTQGSTSSEKIEANTWIERFGMKRFEEAIMWILSECFGISSALLLCTPNEKYGRFVLAEIMMTGNMGHGDERVETGTYRTPWRRFKQSMKRNLTLVHIAPHEALWSPFYKVWKYFWRKFQ